MIFLTTRKRFHRLLAKAELIDERLTLLGKRKLSLEDVKMITQEVLPQALYIGHGAAKVAFLILTPGSRGTRQVVLKVIKNASRMEAYLRPYLITGSSPKMRNYYFLKHYWATKYCILQKFAGKVDKNQPEQKIQMRKIRKRFHGALTDLRDCNLGLDYGKVKIIDALCRRGN